MTSPSKTDNVKIGRHMKGWTLCQKETLCVISLKCLVEDAFSFQMFWHIREKKVNNAGNSLKWNTMLGSKSQYSIVGFSVTDPTLL